jgi:hypothetical protein
VRALTIINVSLWTVLFVASIPYTIAVGWSDPVSSEVRWILLTTGVLLAVLAFVRIRRQRPVLG